MQSNVTGPTLTKGDLEDSTLVFESLRPLAHTIIFQRLLIPSQPEDGESPLLGLYYAYLPDSLARVEKGIADIHQLMKRNAHASLLIIRLLLRERSSDKPKVVEEWNINVAYNPSPAPTADRTKIAESVQSQMFAIISKAQEIAHRTDLNGHLDYEVDYSPKEETWSSWSLLKNFGWSS